MASYLRSSSRPPCDNQYIVKDEPYGSQDSGIYLDNSYSEDCDGNSVSLDSGFSSSFNLSMQDELVFKLEEFQPEQVTALPNEQSILLDGSHGLVRIDHPNQQIINVCRESAPRSFDRQNAVKILPKPQIPRTDERKVRCRKSVLVPKLDEYRPEDVKPSQELLAARRLLEEALITGNIVSQARYARINRRLDRMRMTVAQRSSVIQSFSQKADKSRTRTEDKDKSPRVLYQENRRIEGPKFTWQIGIHGPHKSFNKLSVKRSHHKKRRGPLTDISQANSRT